MMNFKDLPFIDHHCHPYDSRKAILEPEFLAREFFHGMGDIPDLNAPKARMWGATNELRYHFPHLGVVRTMVCQLSKVLDCPPDLDSVAHERNRLAGGQNSKNCFSRSFRRQRADPANNKKRCRDGSKYDFT